MHSRRIVKQKEEIISTEYAVRAPILPDERLAITLRFLASGESQTALSYYF